MGLLSHFGSHPTVATCKLMVYAIQYLRDTVHMGRRYSGSMLDLHVFTDADWASDIITRRSTTSYIVFAAGGPIARQSKLQTTVSTSSMQSEYHRPPMRVCRQELIWLWGVLAEIQRGLREATPFFLDSQSAEDLALNPVFHKRSKHIAIKYHWVREHVDPEGEERTAVLVHVRTGDQTADMLTKALCGPTFEEHRSRSLGEEPKTKKRSYLPLFLGPHGRQ